MTCIVGVVDNNDVWIGGDSASSDGWNIFIRSDEKVFRNGPALFGFTSSFRMGQLLRYSLKFPDRGRQGVDRFMSTTFVDSVRECLKDGGFQSTENGVDEGGVFLVGYAGRLFEIQSDYQVAVVRNGIYAIGCGAQYAFGALYVLPSISPKDRIKKALSAASFYSKGVSPPFKIKKAP